MIEVCREEKMNEILARYKAYNDHAESYTWKYHCNELNMNKTLGMRFNFFKLIFRLIGKMNFNMFIRG